MLENTELIMILTASTSETTDTAETILILNLPQNEKEVPPEFSKAYYLAQYPKKGSGLIEFEDPIEFTNVKDLESITINLDCKYCAAITK